MSAVANEPLIGNSTLENILYVRERVASARFIPIPRGEKAPRLKDWPKKATRELEMLELWFGPGGLYEGDSYGVCNVIAIDVDVKNGTQGVESFRALGIPNEVIASAFRVRTPSGGYHVIYSLPDDVEVRSRDGWRPGIDIKAGLSGQVVGAGCVLMREGIEIGSYAPMNDVVASPCPKMLLDLILAGQRAPKERAQTGSVAAGVEVDSDVNVTRAEAYLAERKGAAEGNRDNWTYKTACAVIDFGISAEMCFDLLAPWDLDKNTPPLGEELVRVKCDSAWRTRTNVVGSASTQAEFAGIQPEAFESVEPIELPKARPRRLWLGDKSINTSQQWLMWNRLPRIGTAALAGPSQSGKTFLALDLAACLGSGTLWLGETGEERVGSIILSAEGIGGLPARIKGYDYTGPVVAIPVGALNTDKAKAALVAEIEEARDEIRSKFDVRLGLVVIDTITAAGLLAQENDNSEIGGMIKYLEEIATTFRCICMTIHHPPKSGTGLRGGSALHAGFDVVVEVFQQGNERFVECTKNRDGEAGSWGSFVLEKIIVEPDLSGAGRDTTTQRVIYGAAKRNQKLFTFVDSSLVDAILEAVGDGRHRKNWSSDKSSIIDIIGDAAGLDTTKRVGKDTAKAYLEAMLKSGQLIEVEGRDEHRNRVLYVETPKVADATGGVSGA